MKSEATYNVSEPNLKEFRKYVKNQAYNIDLVYM